MKNVIFIIVFLIIIAIIIILTYLPKSNILEDKNVGGSVELIIKGKKIGEISCDFPGNFNRFGQEYAVYEEWFSRVYILIHTYDCNRNPRTGAMEWNCTTKDYKSEQRVIFGVIKETATTQGCSTTFGESVPDKFKYIELT